MHYLYCYLVNSEILPQFIIVDVHICMIENLHVNLSSYKINYFAPIFMFVIFCFPCVLVIVNGINFGPKFLAISLCTLRQRLFHFE